MKNLLRLSFEIYKKICIISHVLLHLNFIDFVAEFLLIFTSFLLLYKQVLKGFRDIN